MKWYNRTRLGGVSMTHKGTVSNQLPILEIMNPTEIPYLQI